MLLPIACGGSPAPSASPSPDAVVGVVNGHALRAGDVDAVRAERRLVGEAVLKEAALFEETVDRELVRQEAARLGVTAGVAKIDKQLADLASQVGGATALQAALAKAHMTQAQLRQAITYVVLRDSVQEAKFPKTRVSQATARAYYEAHLRDLFTRPASVRLGTVLVRTRMGAENVLKRLRQGYPFEQVARSSSIDPAARSSGGDQGWVLTGSLPTPLRAAVQSMKSVGLFTKPVGGPGGWYVLDVVARRPAEVLPFAKVRTRLSADLTRARRAKALDAWLVGARKAASVQEK